jgi:hypothetical protein
MQRRVSKTIEFIQPLWILPLLMIVGCGDPCLDDGPPTSECKNAASGSETASSAASAETGTAEGSSAEASSADGTGDGDGDGNTGDGDGDTGDGDGDTGDGDGEPGDGDGDGDPCENGRQDPNETGIDCGGDCVEINPENENDIEGQCNEGDLCSLDIDCTAGFCDEGLCNVCPDDPPEFDPIELGYNECQSCLLTNCCEAVLDCFENIEKCVCWFNCVSSTGDTQTCMDECGNGNIGTINSCMNSECKADDVSLNCDVL